MKKILCLAVSFMFFAAGFSACSNNQDSTVASIEILNSLGQEISIVKVQSLSNPSITMRAVLKNAAGEIITAYDTENILWTITHQMLYLTPTKGYTSTVSWQPGAAATNATTLSVEYNGFKITLPLHVSYD